ncbi:tRNA uridine-5-carboxymethylaminomethyl(34) synthesis GTPase MnmE [Paramuribaculum intestinale]|uniref:tRNA uridine-5-carboxymethylaminomethyl(34) synthesis GTPase MnmE n=1 Tax=Paramuribaculum intestinale TaxID=2094151 RepID=UPI0025A6612B|nr:tRNA uridine-5-carboxymethylaminomethyl(34) synthesis GTPase MnmE [Paramuribaculum intestinale]
MIESDTICAISTPPGCGGIAVVRISGENAIGIAGRIWKGKALSDVRARTSTLGDIVDPATGDTTDTALAMVMHAPHSFTGEDTVEFSVHGSTWIQSEILRLLIDCGCRMAQPGEFTRRAFASGKMDLAQAEAVADVIASTSKESHRIAAQQMRGGISRRLGELRSQLLDLSALLELELDFSEEDVEFASRTRLLDIAHNVKKEVATLAASFSKGKAIKEGIPVAIVGNTNAGKSTLINALLEDDRAIVSDIPGTTRDTIEDTVRIDGMEFRLVDTAGIRTTDDTIEALGIERSLKALRQARIAIAVIDTTTQPEDSGQILRRVEQEKSDDTLIVVALNKCDSGTAAPHRLAVQSMTPNARIIELSALHGSGVDTLRQQLLELADRPALNDIVVSNARHYEALTLAMESITHVIDGLSADLSRVLIAEDLRQTLHHLGEITGDITTPEILSTIFSRFCIGK